MSQGKNKNSFKCYDASGQNMLHGNAAILRIMSIAGGADAFVAQIADKAIQVATPIIVAETIKSYSKPPLKVVKSS